MTGRARCEILIASATGSISKTLEIRPIGVIAIKSCLMVRKHAHERWAVCRNLCRGLHASRICRICGELSLSDNTTLVIANGIAGSSTSLISRLRDFGNNCYRLTNLSRRNESAASPFFLWAVFTWRLWLVTLAWCQSSANYTDRSILTFVTFNEIIYNDGPKDFHT